MLKLRINLIARNDLLEIKDYISEELENPDAGEGHGDRYLDPPLSTKSGESIIEIGSSFLFAHYPPAIHPRPTAHRPTTISRPVVRGDRAFGAFHGR
ncbi:MAG: hypothetical protein WBI21_04495 [Natronincolaceae bacterium]